MMVTRDLKRDKANVRTNVFYCFVTEHSQKKKQVAFLKLNKIGTSMIFVHFLRDDADNILTVYLDKYVDFDSQSLQSKL